MDPSSTSRQEKRVPRTAAQPTEQDLKTATIRRQLADRQAADYAEAVRLALGALGPGWTPWMKLSLIDADHRHSGNAEPVAVAYKVYRGEERLSENSLYIRRMPDGRVMKADRYEPLFGALLAEKHPTRTVEVRGQQAPIDRYELCWSALELYHPRTAEQLAELRATRGRKKEERADQKFEEDFPLLTQAGITRKDLEGE